MANTAENLAGKERVEKRRALGRGLESLLPGPRVVQAPRNIPAETSGAAREQPLSRDAKNDNPSNQNASHGQIAGAASENHVDVIRAVVEEDAELRSAVQPGAVPTLNPAIVAGASVPQMGHSGGTQAGAPAPHVPDETITIFAQAEAGRMPGNLVMNLAISDIDKNPFQTRYIDETEALEELAESIKATGVIQPISVRPAEEEGRYVLILGERRLRASKMAGKTTIPAIVKRVSLQQAAEMTVVENLQREDLNPIEQAEAFRVLSSQFNLTQQQIGERVGMSRESVSNFMRLLKLPQNAKEYLIRGSLTFSEARELLKLDDGQLIYKAAERAVSEQMKLEQVEEMVMRMTSWIDPLEGMVGKVKKKGAARWVDPNVKEAQRELEGLLGVRVRIRDRKGKGKIVIEYANVDDYERVVGMLRGK